MLLGTQINQCEEEKTKTDLQETIAIGGWFAANYGAQSQLKAHTTSAASHRKTARVRTDRQICHAYRDAVRVTDCQDRLTPHVICRLSSSEERHPANLGRRWARLGVRHQQAGKYLYPGRFWHIATIRLHRECAQSRRRH